MDILVLSDEPALGETLASELPEFTLTSARLHEARALLENETFRLVLADGDSEASGKAAAKGDCAYVTLTRPVRLSDLLYTIRSRLQSKSGPARTDVALAPGYILSMGERVIRSGDDAVRITLTEKEAELLACLLENGMETLSREELLKRVWGYGDAIATHTLETHIYRLRGKLRQAHESFDITFSEEHGYQLALT
jgi:DNA-binding response OmpR family regulator